MDKEDIKDYLITEAEYSGKRVDNMSNIELFDAWLKYEGIIGYTQDILEVVEAIFDQKLEG